MEKQLGSLYLSNWKQGLVTIVLQWGDNIFLLLIIEDFRFQRKVLQYGYFPSSNGNFRSDEILDFILIFTMENFKFRIIDPNATIGTKAVKYLSGWQHILSRDSYISLAYKLLWSWYYVHKERPSYWWGIFLFVFILFLSFC